MDDRTLKRPIGVQQYVLGKFESFISSAYFVIIDYEVDFEVPIFFGRPFLATTRAIVDIESGQMKFQFNNEDIIYWFMMNECDLNSVLVGNHIV